MMKSDKEKRKSETGKVIMRKTLTLLVVSLLFLVPGGTQADTDDLFALGVQPNVMLLVDTSSSMDNAIPSNMYNPSTSYPGTSTSTVVYDQGAIYRNSIPDVPDANARTALSTVGFWLGEIGGSNVSLFVGNYLNYEACGAPCNANEKKLDIAKRVVTNLIQNVEGVRFGVMRLRKNPYPPGKRGELIAPIGTDKTTMVNAVNSMVYESGTGIGEQLYDAGQYYKGLPLIDGSQFPSPIQNECQPNFVIQISDGRQNGNIDVRVEASKRFAQDHSSWNTTKQNVIVHMVSFDLGGDATAILEMQEAAANGGGSYFGADDGGDLAQALLSAINLITGETLSIAAPAVPAARSAAGNALYLASFTPSANPLWAGTLTAYPLESDGTINTDANGNIVASPLWEAHTLLNATLAADRDLYTVLLGTTVEAFLNPNAALEAALNVVTDFDGNFTVDSADAQWLVNYVRGDNNTDPAWKLGDIYHSSPVVIGPPSSAYVDLNLDRTVDTSFVSFRTTYQTRDRVLYTGSNAGVLHAFHAGTWVAAAGKGKGKGAPPGYDDGNGAERWGFVPPNLLTRLQNMVREHTYYVDGPPKAADVWLDGVSNDGTAAVANNLKESNEWHTVLVTGERRGGNAYFALDVTDPGTAAAPNPPTYLWTFTDVNLGPTWSRPAVGKVRLSLDGGTTTIERWVAFVGGGYTTGAASGFAYQFTDKDSVTLQREFTRLVAVGALASLNLKLASTVPGATPPASCVADCFAYDPNGASDPASIPPADLGYMGGLDSSNYGSGTTLTNLNLLSSSPVGKAFFVIDINTGSKLWEYTVADDASMDRIPASPTTVDTDGDGFVDRVYVGDVSGNIWRFDLQQAGTTTGLGTLVTGWTASKLFAASTGQPIYDQLAVAADPVGQLYIYGGTGDLNDLLNQTSLDRFYAIQEHYPKATGTLPLPADVPAVVTDLDLADTTGLNTLNVYDPAFAGKVGWYLSLPAGEKVLSDADVFAGVLLFNSFLPTVATCTERGGTTTLYALSYLTGGGASDYNAYKAGTDGLSKTAGTYSGLSGGVKISMPALTSTGGLSGEDVVLFVCTSGEVCGNPPAPQPGSLRSIDYWRDL